MAKSSIKSSKTKIALGIIKSDGNILLQQIIVLIFFFSSHKKFWFSMYNKTEIKTDYEKLQDFLKLYKVLVFSYFLGMLLFLNST